jgi:hypothetical protein
MRLCSPDDRRDLLEHRALPPGPVRLRAAVVAVEPEEGGLIKGPNDLWQQPPRVTAEAFDVGIRPEACGGGGSQIRPGRAASNAVDPPR